MEDKWTDRRTDDPTGRLGRFEADVKGRFDKVDRRFDRFEDQVAARFDKVDERFDKVEDKFVSKAEFAKAETVTKERFERVEGAIAALGGKMDANTRTLWAGIFIAAVVKIFFS